MTLAEIRPQIDAVNQEMLALFERRMALCREVALEKQRTGGEIFVPEREKAILDWVDETADPALREYDHAFFVELMRLSRRYQGDAMRQAEPAGLY